MDIWGEFIAGNPPAPLDVVDHILGVRLLRDKQGRPEFVELHYRGTGDDPFRRLQMPFLDALFTLSCLKSMQLDLGLPFPDDPRARR